MNKLYPIIRRARRPLLPPDEPPQRVIIPVTVEPGPVESVPLVVALAEPAPVVAPDLATPAARRPRKERNRVETPAT